MAEIGEYRIFNCYAPSGSGNKYERNKFYGEDVFKFFQLYSGSLNLLAGDHNSILRREDVEGGFGFPQKFCESLNTLVKSERLLDCFVHLQKPQSFTFHRPGKAKSRLDRFYVPDMLSNDIIALDHLPSTSDHLGVKLILKMNIFKSRVNAKKDFSFWKLNNQILDDDEFLPSFIHLWRHVESQEEGYVDLADWWDMCVESQF